MLAVGILALLAAEILADTAMSSRTLLDALRAQTWPSTNAFIRRVRTRANSGRGEFAQDARSSSLRDSHRDCDRVQMLTHLRCMPQVHGAVRDTAGPLSRGYGNEVNSAVDNPLVFMKGATPHSGANVLVDPASEAPPAWTPT